MEHLAHAQNISSLMGEERQLNSHSGHSAGQHNSRFYFTLHTQLACLLRTGQFNG